MSLRDTKGTFLVVYLCDEVECLGHVVTPHGLKPNNQNLDAVKSYHPPTQLQQFLGLT